MSQVSSSDDFSFNRPGFSTSVDYDSMIRQANAPFLVGLEVRLMT